MERAAIGRVTPSSRGAHRHADVVQRQVPQSDAFASTHLCEVRSETATNSYLHHASSFLGRLKRTHRLHCTSDGWRTNDCKIHVEMLLEDEICRASERVL